MRRARRARYVPVSMGGKGQPRLLTEDEASRRRSRHLQVTNDQRHRLPKLTVQALVRSGFAAVMRVEVWVSSPEPAVGGSVTPGTRQGRRVRPFRRP